MCYGGAHDLPEVKQSETQPLRMIALSPKNHEKFHEIFHESGGTGYYLADGSEDAEFGKQALITRNISPEK